MAKERTNATDGPADGYEAVVFDNDGVLVERTDRDLLARAVRAAFRAFDADPQESLVQDLVGARTVPERILREEYALDVAAFWERRDDEVTAVQLDAIRAGEKALYEDVDALAGLECPLGLVSNNHDEVIEFILSYFDLGGYFETAYGREPTLAGQRQKKPDPHYLERALDDLGTRDALYVGDSEKDVIAAARADIDVAFVRREHRADLTLSAEPTFEVPDLRTLVDALAE